MLTKKNQIPTHTYTPTQIQPTVDDDYDNEFINNHILTGKPQIFACVSVCLCLCKDMNKYPI